MIRQLAVLLAVACTGSLVAGQASQSGGAGTAMLFHDHALVKRNFNLGVDKDGKKHDEVDAFSFEAWISTSDYCHPGAIMSYAIPFAGGDASDQVIASNSFVIFDPKNLVACHDFEIIERNPDTQGVSCLSKYDHGNDTVKDADGIPQTANFIERDGTWHHLAVTWSAENNGQIKIYKDGLVAATAQTGKTDGLKAGGAFMLGSEQDCYGGCTDPHQSFYGLMDEVRVWKKALTSEEILSRHRWAQIGLDNNLIAWYTFDDADEDAAEKGILVTQIKDMSGHNNHIDLLLLPDIQTDQEIGDSGLKGNTARFDANYLINPQVQGMPTKDLTVEFWAKTQSLPDTMDPSAVKDKPEMTAEFFSYATQKPGDGNVENDASDTDSEFWDDSIRIAKYLTEFKGTEFFTGEVDTSGSVSVMINSNRQGAGRLSDNWVDFHTQWTDDQWHHIAVTWKQQTGEVKLYFDGEVQQPFWISDEGNIEGIDTLNEQLASSNIAAATTRGAEGSMVIGHNQECMGGCFSPASALHGELAMLRVWNVVRTAAQIKKDMHKDTPSDAAGLVSNYQMKPAQLSNYPDKKVILDAKGKNNLVLGSDYPTWVHSMAPLTDKEDNELKPPTPGAAGYALRLDDQQVAIKSSFADFPTSALTLEFWMLSTDSCRQGVPFSYAHGDYREGDNSFLLFNYNDWGIAVGEDEGSTVNHNAGFGSTDGKWHYIAVTWELPKGNKDGIAKLYDNGRLMWTVPRGTTAIPAGGTLVLGREQDCEGGCFDSAEGAAGNIQAVDDVEFGPQDFFGLIEEVRIWNKALTQAELRVNMMMDNGLMSNGTAGTMDNPGVDPSSPGLVAYWKFDDEGSSTVKDETNNGNDLTLQKTPRYEVVRWFSLCGDGHLQGSEECDDNNRVNGDGCSSTCEVEQGFDCTSDSPSVCKATGEEFEESTDEVPEVAEPEEETQSSPPPEEGSPPPPAETVDNSEELVAAGNNVADETNDTTTSSQSSSKSKSHGVRNFCITALVLGLVVTALFVLRQPIFKRFPVVEELSTKVYTGTIGAYHRLRGGAGYSRYDVVSLDAENDLGSDFINSAPLRGHYASLPGN